MHHHLPQNAESDHSATTNMAANRVGMPRKRRNDAVTTTSSYNPRTPTVLKRTASQHGRRPPIRGLRCVMHGPVSDGPRHGLGGVTHWSAHCDAAMAVSRRQGKWFTPFWRRPRATMAAAAGGMESNKGVSEGLSALADKSIRVRRESPSKTPKNGFQRVF